MIQREENKQKGTRTHNSHVQSCKVAEIIRQAAEGLLVRSHSTLVSGALRLHPVTCT